MVGAGGPSGVMHVDERGFGESVVPPSRITLVELFARILDGLPCLKIDSTCLNIFGGLAFAIGGYTVTLFEVFSSHCCCRIRNIPSA